MTGPWSSPARYIGDPTWIGWSCCAAYLVAALFAVRAARFPSLGWERRFWWTISGLMVVLGVNKQLDLQTNFINQTRHLTTVLGLNPWYQNVRVVMLAAVALTTVVVLWTVYRRARAQSRSAAVAVIGVSVLAVFVVMRISTFYYVDSRFHVDMSLHDTVWVLELLGSAIVAAAAAVR